MKWRQMNMRDYPTLHFEHTNTHQRKPKRLSQMDNPEKLATQVTQDEEKTKQKHNTICVGHHYAQANTNNVSKT